MMYKKIKSSAFWSVSFILVLSACTKDNIDDLNNTGNNPVVDACDVTYSYANDILPIATANCLGCHSQAAAPYAGSGINIEGYDNFKLHLAAIEGSVNWTPGFKQMPQGGNKLSADKLNILNCWISQGALDN